MGFEVTVALIDDNEVAHGFLQECFLSEKHASATEAGLVREDVRLPKDFSTRFTEVSETRIRERLRKHSGPLLLLLDLDLNFSLEKRKEIVANLQRRISKIEHVGKAVAAAYLEKLLAEGDNRLLSYIDGVSIALETILNPNISPLSIRLATTGLAGAGESVVVLKVLGSKSRSSDCFFVDNNPGGLPFAQAKGVFTPAQVWSDIIQPAVKEVRSNIPKCSSRPEGRLEEYLAWIVGQHNHLVNYGQTSHFESFIRPHLVPFLGIAEDEWYEKIWPHFKKTPGQGANFLKRTGTSSRDTLCASGGWLLALAAFQALHISRPWQDVFRPADLSDQPDGWESFQLTPTLSMGKPINVHEAMRRFFRLCLRLFEADKTKSGPLIKVSLSLSGLEFLLDFDAWDMSNHKECLISKLVKWRDGYLKREGGYLWESELNEGHGTSRALWDWWLMTSLDEDLSLEYAASEVFNVDTCWRIRLKRTQEGQTKVVFCE
jgi:hypothetical protein